VYSSFLLHAERAAERYGIPAHEILQRVGEAGYVGGQEDENLFRMNYNVTPAPEA
jgi:4-hydroxy 2-oxovalerate aldolase